MRPLWFVHVSVNSTVIWGEGGKRGAWWSWDEKGGDKLCSQGQRAAFSASPPSMQPPSKLSWFSHTPVAFLLHVPTFLAIVSDLEKAQQVFSGKEPEPDAGDGGGMKMLCLH